MDSTPLPSRVQALWKLFALISERRSIRKLSLPHQIPKLRKDGHHLDEAVVRANLKLTHVHVLCLTYVLGFRPTPDQPLPLTLDFLRWAYKVFPSAQTLEVLSQPFWTEEEISSVTRIVETVTFEWESIEYVKLGGSQNRRVKQREFIPQPVTTKEAGIQDTITDASQLLITAFFWPQNAGQAILRNLEMMDLIPSWSLSFRFFWDYLGGFLRSAFFFFCNLFIRLCA